MEYSNVDKYNSDQKPILTRSITKKDNKCVRFIKAGECKQTNID